MKLGLNIKIDVTKIDKSRLFKGEKGTYLDLTTFVDVDTKDQYENNGFISQSVSKEERAADVKTPILGNVKVFFKDSENPRAAEPAREAAIGDRAPNNFGDLEDIPFNRYEFKAIV